MMETNIKFSERRIIDAVFVFDSPYSIVLGALCGYVYAKLEDLPAGVVVRAWIVWNVAEQAMMHLASVFAQQRSNQAIIKSIISCLSTAVGIQIFGKMGLMNYKVVIFFIVCQPFTIMRFFQEAAKKSKN